MEAVAHALDVVVAHVTAIDEGEVDAVAGVPDAVPRHQVMRRVPDVNAVPTAVLIELHLAELALRGLALDRQWIDGLLDRLGAEDGVALDAGTVGLPDVDAVQRVVNRVVDDDGAAAGHVDGRLVAAEIEARAADLEAVERDVGGANGHGMGAAVAAKVRTGIGVEADRPVDRERAEVEPARHADGRPVGRVAKRGDQPGSPVGCRRR